MTKNNNFLTILLYLVIVTCFAFLIFHCQKNIKEGLTSMDELKKSEDKIIKQEESIYGETELKSINDAPYTYFEDLSMEAQQPGWKGWTSVAPVMNGASIEKNLDQAKITMDLSGNISDTLLNINNQKDLLRLMGINAIGSRWSDVNDAITPDFIKFYRDKMYFLDDIAGYLTKMCNNDSNCSLPNSESNEGGGNWFNFGGGNKNNQNGINNLQKNIQDTWNSDTKGFQSDFNNMTNGNDNKKK